MLIQAKVKWIVTLICAITVTLSIPAYASDVIVGASGIVNENRLGVRLPDHRYADLTDEPVDVKYVNIEAEEPGQWAAVAAGQFDSALRRWAHTLAGQNVRLVSFNHEPSVDHPKTGTAADYRRAYRHVAASMPRNVQMVWSVTYASLDPLSEEPSRMFWPGAKAVDYVASNSFNRYGCQRKAEPWVSFGKKVEPLLVLARDLHKDVIVSEFGMGARPARARWIRVATEYVARHPRISGLFYYASPYNNTCEWQLETDAEYAALADMVRRLR
jgi:hypothetical protein